MPENPLAELMTERAEAASRQIHELLRGLGPRTQGAVLADLVSLWVAGHFQLTELGKPIGERTETQAMREDLFAEWIELVRALVPESEKQIMQNVEPQGRG